MKKLFLSALFVLTLISNGILAQNDSTKQEVKVFIDLNHVKDDQVMVTIEPPKLSTKETVFYIPKTVPGTYSTDNYGKLVENFKAYDKKGKELPVKKNDINSWQISKANNLVKVTYWVNDTFDTEKGKGFGQTEIFSPAGTNILEGKNFVLNNHGFVGYFENKTDITYNVVVSHPATLYGATSLEDLDSSDTTDNFVTPRYFDLVDNPIMYAKPDYEVFNVGDMEILFSVYSPNGVHSAKELMPYLRKTMTAQKAFLGTINNNKKYTVLLYLSDVKIPDAMGFGALEHHTSTTVVFPEMMDTEELGEQLKDVVSHEFFHIVTPLSIHSKEIQYFDYNNPKMSKHLWMYEGVTEYFANLFQVNQGLITSDEFYNRMAEKITNASAHNDTMPFTEMSANVLVAPYKDQYLNVYEKGALIGMCIDIIIREQSHGKRGILDLMKQLSAQYGPNKPFEDEELFGTVTALTYPEVGEFLNTYVAGKTPIPYEVYFAKIGVTMAKKQVPMNPFLKNKISPLVTVNPRTKEIIFVALQSERNEFMKTLGIESGDIIVEINQKAYNYDNIYDMIMEAEKWKVGEAITLKIKRDGKEQLVNGKVNLSFTEEEGFQFTDNTKESLNTAWLKG